MLNWQHKAFQLDHRLIPVPNKTLDNNKMMQEFKPNYKHKVFSKTCLVRNCKLVNLATKLLRNNNKIYCKILDLAIKLNNKILLIVKHNWHLTISLGNKVSKINWLVSNRIIKHYNRCLQINSQVLI